MLTPVTSLGSVFASVRTDAVVFFLLPVLLALVGFGIHGVIPTPPPYYYPALIVLFDMAHPVCGFWVMSTSRNANPRLRGTLLFLAVIVLITYYLLMYYKHGEYLVVFIAHFSLWHFMKQQQAWFHLSMRPFEAIHSRLAIVNKAGIYAVTWGFFLTSLCGTEVFGWDRVNDLVALPMFLYKPLWFLTALSITAYVVAHLVIYVRFKQVPVSGHLIWLGAGVIWGVSRYLGNSYASPALIIIPHAVAYLVLLHKYVKVHGPRTWSVSPLICLWGVYVLATIYQTYEYVGLLYLRDVDDVSWGLTIAMAVGSIHFMHDKFHWNNRDNPGWAKDVLKA